MAQQRRLQYVRRMAAHQLRPSGPSSATAGLGHEERFPPPKLNAGCRLRKETIAGMCQNWRDAPIAVFPALTPERGGSIH